MNPLKLAMIWGHQNKGSYTIGDLLNESLLKVGLPNNPENKKKLLVYIYGEEN